MSIFSRLFKKVKPTNNEQSNIVDYFDSKTNERVESAVKYSDGYRYLRFDNDSCGIVLHNGGKVEVVFTKLTDSTNQRITLEEETLMAIAMFLQQPGFAEILRTEFHRIAKDNMNALNKENK